MTHINEQLEKNCGTCIWLDEYFGDCCHPQSIGCLSIEEGRKQRLEYAGKGCLRRNYAWWTAKIPSK